MKKLFGLTHDLDGNPVVRESRTVKVGIGLPKGKAIHCWIDAQEKWCVQVGDKVTRVDTVAEAKREYLALRKTAPERKYPQKLPYFTFTKVSPSGDFEPDFEAIEQHGPIPTEIDVVFLKDEPFDYSYQMWTAAEKKCEGDGIHAQRVVSMPLGRNQQAAAEEAQARGDKYFAIVEECRMDGCPFSMADPADPDKGPRCKPHGRLVFQLVRSPRCGGTAYFDTTGFRSVSQLFSSLQIFREMTGGGDAEQGFVAGIPFKMVLRPYKVSFNGRAGTQYGASLEFRAENALAMKRELIERGVDYRLAAVGSLRMLSAAPATDISDLAEIPEEEPLPAPELIENAAALAAEFYPEDAEDDDFTDPPEGATRKPSEKPGLKMPQRKSSSTTGAAAAPAPPVAQEPAGEAEPSDDPLSVYLGALRAREWRCLPGQKELLLRKITVFLERGGSPEQVAGILIDAVGAESPSDVGKDRIPQAVAAFDRAAESQQRTPVTASEIPGFQMQPGDGTLRVRTFE